MSQTQGTVTFLQANFKEIEYLVEYFDDFKLDLSKKNLNYFLKSVSNS